MKNSVTGKNIIVEIDKDYGPYVQVEDFEDYDYLEDELTERFGIEPLTIQPIKKEGEVIAHRIYFGKLSNPRTIQKLVNQIEAKNS